MKTIVGLIKQKVDKELVNLDKIVYATQVYNTCGVTFTNKDKCKV